MKYNGSLSSSLANYEEALKSLRGINIAFHNQSLIIDYFCTYEPFSEFVRRSVFVAPSTLNACWLVLNICEGEKASHISLLDIEDLVARCPQEFQSTWTDILYLTALHQSNVNISGIIRQLSSVPIPLSDKGTIYPEVTQESHKTYHPTRPSISKQPTTYSDEYASPQVSPLATSGKSTLALIGLLFLFFVAAYNSTSNVVTSSSEPSTDSSGATDALAIQIAERGKAVLVCEHSTAIENLLAINLVEPNNIRLRDEEVAKSRKAIKILDQKGTHPYWESPDCRIGYQWFNKHTESGYRIFVAVSPHCTRPVLSYSESVGTRVLARGTYALPPGFKTGNILFRYLDQDPDRKGSLDSFSCT